MAYQSNQFKSISFRICVYPSECDKGYYVAHCLELDVIGTDKTVEGAVAELLQAIETQLDMAVKYNANPERWAPDEVWQKYLKSRKLSDELLGRIIENANKRLGHPSPINVDTIAETNSTDCCATC
jgi:predicted RNase H-like HicB family nuclease